ncbi:centrosomal protein of 78 kDa-like isoform X2 [Corticium candelabrum]|uniref:centrosomal protein of 78 kDa-like isoform X2 n=1 Tax=Corticium candelabrum TaxID=121492 RepID=UPI002E269D37|nr:centrosomal protein of 78 kDa-like isoform X2 [Corticium candelabrum]
MSSIATVQIRQRGSVDFPAYYESLCALQDTCPLREVLSGARQGRIEVNADRVRAPDWYPLLKALQINKSLNHIAFRRYRHRQPSPEERQSWNRCRFGARVRTPAIGRRDMMLKLSRAIADCLSVTTSLESLELEDISLQSPDVSVLAKGVTKNKSLKHFSLKFCRIGDNNLDILCKSLKNMKTIVSVDFSGCCLTGKGAKTVADLIQHQATERDSEAWKESLRHRQPDLESMSGLKRVTLCSNPLLGDKGAVALSETLKDDLWLKAIDLQQCGLTNVGAISLQNVMQFNTNLVVIDIRLNQLVDPGLRDSILEQVTANSATDVSQDLYPWLSLVSMSVTKQQASVKLSKSVRSANSRVSAKRHSLTSYHLTKQSSPRITKPQRGLPRRTAASSSNYWHGGNRKSNVGRGNHESDTPSELSQPSSPSLGSVSHNGQNGPSDMPILSTVVQQGDRAVAHIEQDLRRLQVEVESCHRLLSEEAECRATAEARVIELEVENEKLKAQLCGSLPNVYTVRPHYSDTQQFDTFTF